MFFLYINMDKDILKLIFYSRDEVDIHVAVIEYLNKNCADYCDHIWHPGHINIIHDEYDDLHIVSTKQCLYIHRDKRTICDICQKYFNKVSAYLAGTEATGIGSLDHAHNLNTCLIKLHRKVDKFKN
jgi:hypothetical protein